MQPARRIVVYTFLSLATVLGITFSSKIYPDNPALGQVVVVGGAVAIAIAVMSKDKNSGK
ncbi:hypothetical protein AB8O64_20960 [Streptomyces sp. QH1-20]|uniref:hypothetical protein n=1 Tax=Streptomyces sp. QH1-20 TaxID=3240934 RepID=UPI003518EDA0